MTQGKREEGEAIATQSWPEHSCYEWNRQHYVSTPEYWASVCGTCGHITGFMWRDKWKRIVSLFTSEVLLRKEIAWWFKTHWWKLFRRQP
jgi:hypothetical protein